MAKGGRFTKPKTRDVGLWHMLRDVLVASINKGQFPAAILGLVLIVLLLRYPAQELPELVFQFLDRLADLSLLGYVLAAVLGLGWFVHARWQRRMLGGEIDRLAKERTIWQSKHLGVPLESSDDS